MKLALVSTSFGDWLVARDSNDASLLISRPVIVGPSFKSDLCMHFEQYEYLDAFRARKSEEYFSFRPSFKMQRAQKKEESIMKPFLCLFRLVKICKCAIEG